MPSVRLPILTLAVREQRYSCHGCGNCCRDFTVQLREEDLKKLQAQGWEEKLGRPVTVEFKGVTYLRQREDGACVFLMDDGLCRIHKEFGFGEKPIACQLFPFHLTPGSSGIAMGINFACQSVLENKGAELRTHLNELNRMRGILSELGAAQQPSPMLTARLRASKREEQSLVEHAEHWMRRDELPLDQRLDGLAWVVSSLAQAKIENVREDRFADLLDVLFGALPEELEHHPIDPPTARQSRMLRQAVFARTEDPKLNVIEKQGRWRTTLAQLSRSRRFKRGAGAAPRIGEGWPAEVPMESVGRVALGADHDDVKAIDDLVTRYMRATILGGRCWGAGYYGWSMVDGLQALLLNVAVIGWLSRLHALGRGQEHLNIIDVRASIGRVDRTAGRARWLGGAMERLRLKYLMMDDGLRRLLREQWATSN